jgi:hypothetical protein
MKPGRVALALVPFVMIGVLAGAAYRAMDEESSLCAGFTPAKMLENPELAREMFGARDGSSAGARAQLESMVSELREAHGCGQLEEVSGERGTEAPHASPRLPPGHPPIQSSPHVPLFEAGPTTHTI